jgi:RNA 2',3'-cyclic 3'-phosphodiesterase
MDEVKNIRAFLALDPPDDIRLNIGSLQNRMKKTVRGEIRWVNPGGIHLTLKFFGSIPAGDVPAITDAIRPLTSVTRQFSLEIRSAGVFPNAARPRVLWLGMGGETARLVSLQAQIDDILAGAGFPKEARPFRPHLTLARIKSPQGLAGISKLLETRDDFAAGAFTGRGLTLFKSELTPQGAIYSQLSHFPFQEAS